MDVFYRYPKMYVVRPPFFLPIISLLRNAAMNSLQYKSEMGCVKSLECYSGINLKFAVV